jgi:hypothetical protein
MLPVLVPVLFTFYIQGVLILKKNSGAKGLRHFFFWNDLTQGRPYLLAELSLDHASCFKQDAVNSHKVSFSKNVAPTWKELTKKFSYDLLDPYENQLYSQIFTEQIFNIFSHHGCYRREVGVGESVMAYETFVGWKFRGILYPVVQLALYHNRVVKCRPQASEELLPSDNISRYEIYFLA